jgi:endonuclease YncB( thermonuclease family)
MGCVQSSLDQPSIEQTLLDQPLINQPLINQTPISSDSTEELLKQLKEKEAIIKDLQTQLGERNLTNRIDKLLLMSEEDLMQIQMGYSETMAIVRIIDVYDGDTFTCVFWNTDKLCYEAIRCRLSGIDAPEMKVSTDLSKKRRKYLHRIAEEAKTALIQWTNDPNYIYIAYMKDGDDEKFNRILLDLYRFKKEELPSYDCDANRYWLFSQFFYKESLSEFMLDNTKSRPYFGGKKEEF